MDIKTYRKEDIMTTLFEHKCNKTYTMSLNNLVKHIQLNCQLNQTHRCKNCQSRELYTLYGIVDHMQNDCEMTQLVCKNCFVNFARKEKDKHKCEMKEKNEMDYMNLYQQKSIEFQNYKKLLNLEQKKVNKRVIDP